MGKLERLEIPAVCRVVKDWFWTRPAEGVVREVKDHIRKSGQPHLWRGHTHTKPAKTARPVYLDEFDLPEALMRAKRFAPCPCCWPEHAKYGAKGKIAWFPEEGVIRLLGPDCFAALNPEGHAKAVEQMNREREEKRSTEFLLDHLPRLPEAIRVIERAVTVGEATKAFHDTLQGKLAMGGVALWPYVKRGGELIVQEKQEIFRRGHDGNMNTQEVDGDRTFATLPGYRMLDPGLNVPVAALVTALRNLRPFDFGDDCEAAVEPMALEVKSKAAKMIGRSMGKARDAIVELEDLRRFVEAVTINTLRRWGEDKGCPYPLIYTHAGDRINFGKSEYRSLTVPIPPEMLQRIGTIEFWADLPRRTDT